MWKLERVLTHSDFVKQRPFYHSEIRTVFSLGFENWEMGTSSCFLSLLLCCLFLFGISYQFTLWKLWIMILSLSLTCLRWFSFKFFLAFSYSFYSTSSYQICNCVVLPNNETRHVDRIFRSLKPKSYRYTYDFVWNYSTALEQWSDLLGGTSSQVPISYVLIS